MNDIINNIINHIYDYFYNIQSRYDNWISVTDEEIEKSKNDKYYKLIVFIKRYRKYITSILLIIIIWLYYCNYYNINNENYLNNKSHLNKILQEGSGSFDKYAKSRIQAKTAAVGKSIKGAPMSAAKGAYKGAVAGRDMVAEGAGKFKAMSGYIYQMLFEIALVIVIFISFGPIVFFAVALIVCYALMKKKIVYVKGL
jgi:hypothetical protein